MTLVHAVHMKVRQALMGPHLENPQNGPSPCLNPESKPSSQFSPEHQPSALTTEL